MSEKIRKLADELSEKAFGQIFKERENKEDVNVRKGIEAINKSIESNQEVIEAMISISKDVTKTIGTSTLNQLCIAYKMFDENREKLSRAMQEYEPAYANFLALKSLIKEEGNKDE